MDFDYSKIYRLKGKVQHYAWGGTEFIPKLTGLSNPDRKPVAEYWMGAHQSAPAEIAMDNKTRVSLDEVVNADPLSALGADVANHFHRLPYLFKILDVRDMLSIQVHPGKKDAEFEFNRENAEGITLDDPRRNYKDDNHKPELSFAISDVRLLHGFKPADELAATLEEYPEFKDLLRLFLEKGYRALYAEVMKMPQEKVNAILQPILDRIQPLYDKGQLTAGEEDFWAVRAARTFNQPGRTDRGIFSIYFFNLVCFKPGEAIFQQAGLPHAYLEGQMAEIMANSDNVLRGGLTVKHVDVTELLKHVVCEPTHPGILRPELEPPCEKIFRTPAPDFELHLFELQPGEQAGFRSQTAEILFVLDGELEIKDGNSLSLDKGQAAIAFAGNTLNIHALKMSRLLRATVPVNRR